jgi:hypothetical protein
MNDADHTTRHLRGYLGDRASAQMRGSCARQKGQIGCGMATCWADTHKSWENEEIKDTRKRKVTQKKSPDWAGATPLLGAFSRPKYRGIAPARTEQLGAVFCPRVGVGPGSL